MITVLRMTLAVRIDNQIDTLTAEDDDESNEYADVDLGHQDEEFSMNEMSGELIGESEFMDKYIPDSSYNLTLMEEDGLYPNELQWK